jgi:FlaA1/EpsC-like NDP-sugar epimerase
LVTGAGGSIGSEIVRQVIKLKPAKVILLDHAEFSLYSIDREVQTALRFLQMEFPVITALQTITDMDAVFKLMQMHSVDTVYHAAAYKHVPLVEHNIAQGFYNNVWGTLAVAQAAIKAEVARFIFVSTDKAVRPTNIMGASKRLCEMALQAFNSESELSLVDASFTAMQTSIKVANKTCFTMVRFGNVLGSSGSVIPLFKQQIKTGGPVTITHPEIIRYFMSIPEAAELVLQAGAMGNGGDVFVLDMGEPVKIIDLAKRMISLSGLTVVDDTSGQGDIELVFTGLREGEKLYEELLIGENPENTEHPRIFKANEQMLSLQDLLQLLRDLQQSVNQQNFARFKQLIGSDVVGFHAA